MKTHTVEIQRIKGMAAANGAIVAQIDVLIENAPPPKEDKLPTSWLRLSEENARVLMALLKSNLGELDKKKGRSQR
jgi:hypothetical protein